MEDGELTLWCNLLRVTHLQMRHRRGEHCSPAARPEPVQGTATHPVNHNVYRWDSNGKPRQENGADST